MPTSDEKQRLLARLINENRVRFLLDTTPDDWPEQYVGVFSKVRNLGIVKFEQYREEAQSHPDRSPWKFQRLSEAQNLVQLTLRCIRERLNEAGWRSQLEHHLFGAFTYGLSCNTCGGRLLRALEDPPEASFEPLVRNLQLRRENRQECQCLRSGGAQQPERTLNELFSSRAGEYIVKDPAADELVPKQGPDRVYGLRKTLDLEEILALKYSPPAAEQPIVERTLSDALQISPFPDADEPLLLPFLVAEFKSEKNAVGFSDVQSQSALPIRRLLQLQMNLRAAAPTKSSAVLNPLVWFFAFRGDDVRFYAAYTVNEDLEIGYEIVCLLDFRISKRDGALQMLLLVDFLLEWARDIYLPMIKHQLKILAADDPDSYSFHEGTNATTLNHRGKKRPFEPELAVSSEPGDVTSTLDLVPEGLDTPMGIVRSAYNIESRFRGLLLRKHDAENLFAALNVRRERSAGMYVRKLADKMVRLFRVSNSSIEDRCLISERSLNELEEIWTGNARKITDPDRLRFWAKIQFTTYLSHDWEQVRELSYIAVSEKALWVIQKWSEVKLAYVHKPSEVTFVLLERILMKLKEGSVEHNLAAAISRSTLSLPQVLIANEASGYSNDTGSIWDQDVPVQRLGDGFSYEIVLSISEHLQHRRRDPSQYGLRESRTSELQQQTVPMNPWPLTVPRLVQCAKGIVLVHGEYSAKTRAVRELRGHQKPDLCVFVLERLPRFVEQLGAALKDTLLTWTVFSTVRRDWSNLSAAWGDRNTSLDFVNLVDQWPRREQDAEVVAAAILKWMELLKVTPGDDLPQPQTTFEPNNRHWSFGVITRDKQDWGKRMAEYADVHRRARGLLIEDDITISHAPSMSTRAAPRDHSRPLNSQVSTLLTQRDSTFSTASRSSSFGTDEYLIETVDLTQDSD